MTPGSGQVYLRTWRESDLTRGWGVAPQLTTADGSKDAWTVNPNNADFRSTLCVGDVEMRIVDVALGEGTSWNERYVRATGYHPNVHVRVEIERRAAPCAQ